MIVLKKKTEGVDSHAVAQAVKSADRALEEFHVFQMASRGVFTPDRVKEIQKAEEILKLATTDLHALAIKAGAGRWM